MYSFTNLCRFCKKSGKHFIDVTSKMFPEIIKIYNILCKDTDAELNMCFQKVCQTCFQILTSVSEILSKCNRTDTFFKEYLANLKTNDKSSVKCECIIKNEVIDYGDVNQCHNTIKKEFLMDLNGPLTSNEYNDKTNLALHDLEKRITIDVVDEIKFIPIQDIEHVYLKCSGPDTLFNENNFNHQDDGGHKNDSQHEEFNNTTKLNRHVKNSTGKLNECDKSIHANEQRFKCDVCNKTFNLKGNLNIHKRSHTGECPFECDICNKKFTRKETLIGHIRIHTGEHPFECDVCNKKFNRIGNLNKHKFIHTGERSFECEVCNKKFTEKGSLKIHYRIHTRERPFECDVCNKKFIRQGHLNDHKRIHTGERPFECDVCNKKFYEKSNLLRHTRIH